MTVIFNPAALAEVLRGPTGPVYRWQLENGALVREEAKRLAPVHQPQPGEQRGRAPGTLRDSIVMRIREEVGAPVVEVGTSDPVGLWVHEGTSAHQISGNPLLVFYWSKVGKVVGFHHVNHPGTQPHRFLLQALEILRGRF